MSVQLDETIMVDGKHIRYDYYVFITLSKITYCGVIKEFLRSKRDHQGITKSICFKLKLYMKKS